MIGMIISVIFLALLPLILSSLFSSSNKSTESFLTENLLSTGIGSSRFQSAGWVGLAAFYNNEIMHKSLPELRREVNNNDASSTTYNTTAVSLLSIASAFIVYRLPSSLAPIDGSLHFLLTRENVLGSVMGIYALGHSIAGIT